MKAKNSSAGSFSYYEESKDQSFCDKEKSQNFYNQSY